VHLARPGSRFDCLVERPRPGLVSPPVRMFRGPSGTPTVGARRYWWPLVASAVGICGLLTVGYHSIADSGGYGRCGFRLMGVPRRSASSWSSMCQPRSAPSGAPRVPVADLALGNSVGAIGMAAGAPPVRRCRPRRAGCVSHPFHDIPAPPLSGGGGRASSGARAKGRIWLILPVVICLSQRLSHACLSISTLLL
jgi:hypothetical protein